MQNFLFILAGIEKKCNFFFFFGGIEKRLKILYLFLQGLKTITVIEKRCKILYLFLHGLKIDTHIQPGKPHLSFHTRFYVESDEQVGIKTTHGGGHKRH